MKSRENMRIVLPSTIAHEVRCSPTTIRKVIGELCKTGVIESEVTPTGRQPLTVAEGYAVIDALLGTG